MASGQKLTQDGCICEPETNFYARILLYLSPFSPILFENTIRQIYVKNPACGFSCNLVLQAEAEKFMEKLSGFLDTLSVPTCLNGAVTSWFDTGEPFVVEYPQ